VLFRVLETLHLGVLHIVFIIWVTPGHRFV
jgi:hypothetical protein